MDADSCLLVGEAWNLKARLLDLINVVRMQTSSTLYMSSVLRKNGSPEKRRLASTLLRTRLPEEIRGRELPGFSFWNNPVSNSN